MIEHWSFYVGSGAIRFYLPLDQQLTNDFFAQAVVVTKGFKVRSGVQQRILAALQRPEFQQVVSRVSPLELGPPVGWPLKFRVSGPDAGKVRELAQTFASVLGNSPERAQRQLRLERTLQGRARRGRSGPRASAWHQLASLEPDDQCCLVWNERYAGARRNLSHRYRGARHPRGARETRNAAQPDARGSRRQVRPAGAGGQTLLWP